MGQPCYCMNNIKAYLKHNASLYADEQAFCKHNYSNPEFRFSDSCSESTHILSARVHADAAILARLFNSNVSAPHGTADALCTAQTKQV